MVEETQAFAKFFWGFTAAGVSEDGMPRFVNTLMIHLAVPPYTEFTREATDEDIETYDGPYRLFQKQTIAREPGVEQQGYPLAMWPVISPAHLNMLAARDIFTVEALAALSARGSSMKNAPAELKELSERAQLMMQMTKDIGQFEAIVRDKDGQLQALKEQVLELTNTIKAQDGLINSMKKAA